MGMVSGFFGGLKARNDTLWEQPSAYHAVNWLTLGTADLVRGAVAPDEPLSLEHWLSSLGVASIAAGVWSMASSSRTPTTGQLADYAAKQPSHVKSGVDAAAQRAELIRQLERQGEKCTPENIIDIARLPSGEIVWLETGTKSEGFNHILKHIEQFETQGILLQTTSCTRLQTAELSVCRGRVKSMKSPTKALPAVWPLMSVTMVLL